MGSLRNEEILKYEEINARSKFKVKIPSFQVLAEKWHKKSFQKIVLRGFKSMKPSQKLPNRRPESQRTKSDSRD